MHSIPGWLDFDGWDTTVRRMRLFPRWFVVGMCCIVRNVRLGVWAAGVLGRSACGVMAELERMKFVIGGSTGKLGIEKCLIRPPRR